MSREKKLFKNEELSKLFNNQGFIKYKICEEEDLDKLKAYFYKHEKEYTNSDFHASMNNTDLEAKKRIYNYLNDWGNSKCNNLLIDYSALFANYIFKRANSSYKVGIHQDWSYIDEGAFTSINVWLPLIETSEKNGGLYVLPKSHLLPEQPRFTPFEDPFSEVHDLIKSNSTCIQTSPGEAILYHSKLIHFSNENSSDQDRLACAFLMTPNQSSPIHYFKKNQVMLKFDVKPEFFLSFPNYEGLQSYPHTIVENSPKLSKMQLEAFIKQL